MACPRFVVRWLTHAAGTREALVGDVLEEVARGRSPVWVCYQLLGLYVFTLVARVRHRARLTPHAVALIVGMALLCGVSVASVSSVLQMWLAVYLIAGTVSLFAHMASHSIDGRAAGIAAEEER